MAKDKTNTVSAQKKPPAGRGVSLSQLVVSDVHGLLKGSNVSEEDVAKVLYVMAANEARIAAITTVLELTPAIVKNLYETNPNTNAFTDALQTKLAGIEALATADQSAVEISTAYGSIVTAASQVEAEAGTETGLRTWSPLRVAQAIAALAAGGADQTAVEIRDLLQTLEGAARLDASAIQNLPAGGSSTGDFELSAVAGAFTVVGEYVGANPPTMAEPVSVGNYIIVVPAGTRVISYTVESPSNNATLTASNELVLQIDNSANAIRRSYGVSQYQAAGASHDKFGLGTAETESFPSTDVTQLLFPGMNGFGSAGFRLVLA